MLAQLTSFLGANTRIEARALPDGVCVSSTNQKPSESGDFRPWRNALAISGPVVPSGRLTIYRMGRDTPSATAYWLSWTAVVHAIRGFETNDTTERTYFTGSGGPKWTDNTIALASTPYPTASRDLSVPQPTVAPGVTLDTEAADGDQTRLYYCFTWVNELGWESAPSPPTLAPLAKPASIMDLESTETVPSGNFNVTTIRWYRTQTTGAEGDAEFFFLRDYAIGSSGMQDDGRAVGVDVLPTQPNTIRLSLPSTAKGLTTCWNQFAAAIVGKTVRFCEPTLMYAWPLGNEYEVADTPVALAAFAQRLLVLTTGGAELFTGSDPEALDQKPMALAPCVSDRSVVTGESFCIWAAADGLWFYSQESYRNLIGECLKPEQWAALEPETIHGHYFELGNRPLYVGFYSVDDEWQGFVVDPANPLGIYFLSAGYPTAYWDKLQRKLFVLDGSTLKQFDAGESYMVATAKGKVHRQVADTEMDWIELLAGGSTTVKIYADGVNIYEHAITSGEHRPHDGSQGREFQLEISTQTSVQGLVIE